MTSFHGVGGFVGGLDLRTRKRTRMKDNVSQYGCLRRTRLKSPDDAS